MIINEEMLKTYPFLYSGRDILNEFYKTMGDIVADVERNNPVERGGAVFAKSRIDVVQLTAHSALIIEWYKGNVDPETFLAWTNIDDVFSDLEINHDYEYQPSGSEPSRIAYKKCEEVCGFKPKYTWICRESVKDEVYNFMMLLLQKYYDKQHGNNIVVCVHKATDNGLFKKAYVKYNNLKNHVNNVADFPVIKNARAYGVIKTVPMTTSITTHEGYIKSVELVNIPVLKGCANPFLYGDISNIYGTLNSGLMGDVSGITGDITNLCGDATGITFTIKERLTELTDIKKLLQHPLSQRFKLLTNAENTTLWKAWQKLAHCTLGLTDEERALIDNPIKENPPFPVDEWGRYYVEDKDYMYVYSINPADLLLLKDVNKISTCFCLNSGGDTRWPGGMRCLIALNAINKNFGCVFKIRQDDVKVLRQFKDLKFKWFNPQEGKYFQYDSEGNLRFTEYSMDNPMALDNTISAPKVEPIYGHDGESRGHDRQKKLAYLETHIADGYTWGAEFVDVKEKDDIVIVNNYGAILLDKDFNIKAQTDDITFDTDAIIADAKKMKEITDGIEI